MEKKQKCKRIRLSVEIVFDDPVEALGLTLNAPSWVHAVKDVTRYYLQESAENKPVTFSVDAQFSDAASAVQAKAILN